MIGLIITKMIYSEIGTVGSVEYIYVIGGIQLIEQNTNLGHEENIAKGFYLLLYLIALKTLSRSTINLQFSSGHEYREKAFYGIRYLPLKVKLIGYQQILIGYW